MNLAPWLFDRHILSMVPFIRDKEWSSYNFTMVPFWIRVFNISMSLMDRKLALEVGRTVGKVMAIDWRDRGGCWIDFIRVRPMLVT